jgi:sugar lactone lactonase YvrE
MDNLKIEIILSLNCKLAEGLHWDSERNALWFVDILNQTLYCYNIEKLELKKRSFSEPIGWVIPIVNSDKILIGLKSGVAIIHYFETNDNLKWFNKDFPGNTDLRLNDAKIDKFGRLWFGSINTVDESLPVGSLARLNFQDNNLEIIDTNYKVTNGPAFNIDNTIMLHNDSGNKITYKFQLDKNSGEIINKSIWRIYNEDEGYPDGMTFDSDENVWIAHWGVGKVCKYNTNGKLLQSISFPTPNITNVCFGGKDLNRLFVTSASNIFDNSNNNYSENDGAVFEIIGTNTKGLKSHSPNFLF